MGKYKLMNYITQVFAIVFHIKSVYCYRRIFVKRFIIFGRFSYFFKIVRIHNSKLPQGVVETQPTK